MKRGGPLKRKAPLRARKGLSRGKGLQAGSEGLTRRAPPAQRSKKAPRATAGEIRHLEAVKLLPCRACGRSGPSDAHHCFHDRATRYGGKRAPHIETIPLCKECHQDGPDAIHSIKRQWRERHGPDWSHVPAVKAAIYGNRSIDQAGIERFWSNW